MILTLKDSIKSASNIYDVLVCLYRVVVVSDKENKMIINYCEAIENNKYEKLQKDIGSLLNSFLHSSIFDDSFLYFKEELARMVDKDNIFFVSIFILGRFDKVLLKKEEFSILGFKKKVSVDITSKIGPLNSNHMEAYGFYVNPEQSIIKSSKVYKGKEFKLPDLSSGGLGDFLENYQIIEKTSTNPIVNIDLYNNVRLFEKSDKKLKIGIIPFSSAEWFEIEKESYDKVGRNYFSVNNKEAYIDEINDSYLKILKKMEMENVDIVIFPELAMNWKTEKKIKDFLIDKSLNTNLKSVKLIFLGSNWSDGKNHCTLLSGTGSSILHNQKSKAFIVTDKKGYNYYEKLDGKPKYINFLDIPELGRISYRICKDALDAIEETKHWQEFGVSLEVVSCYSRSLSYFKNTYERMSRDYHGMNILANCCKERLRCGTIGFISLPAKTRGELSHSSAYFKYYETDDNCNKNCSFCKCSYIYEIDFDQEELTDNCCSFKVDLSKLKVE